MNPRELVAGFVETALDRAGLGYLDHHKEYSARRLAEGAVEYGEFQYRTAPCPIEAREEGIDGGNWAGLEYVKRWEADDIDQSCELLLEAAALYAQGAEKLRQYVELRGG